MPSPVQFMRSMMRTPSGSPSGTKMRSVGQIALASFRPPSRAAARPRDAGSSRPDFPPLNPRTLHRRSLVAPSPRTYRIHPRIFSGTGFGLLKIPFLALGQPIAFTIHFEDVDPMGQAIEPGIGKAFAAKDIGLFVEQQGAFS